MLALLDCNCKRSSIIIISMAYFRYVYTLLTTDYQVMVYTNSMVKVVFALLTISYQVYTKYALVVRMNMLQQ